jgi:uncharacterized protein (DUF39 family)
VIDYSVDYPSGEAKPIKYVSYEELRSGFIEIDGKKVPTSPMSSYYKAREIAELLKDWIKSGKFFLTQPSDRIPAPESNVIIESEDRS